MRWIARGPGIVLILAMISLCRAQTTVPLRSQSREPDFSAFSMTKPARVVSVLPEGCSAGEVVAWSNGGPAAGLYLCVSGSWSAIVAHGHSVADLSGIVGKQGDGNLLQTFGGGAAPEGYCVEFDQYGGLRSSGGPCTPAGVPNASASFTGQTSVAVVHGRGTRDVVVSCFDAGHDWFLPDRIAAYDNNTVIAYFSQAQSGSCVVNAGGTGGSGGGGSVSSVFGRTGTVMAANGDYDFGKIAGTAALVQGGTNQNAWTAGRCVQVSSDGTRLESAGAGCGTSGVTSVYGRSGAVTAQTGDYQFSQITGLVSLAQGGTGGGTASAARQNLLPAYSSNGGRCLALNAGGTDTEWVTCGSGGSGGQVAGTGLLGTGSGADPFRVNPATVPMYLSASGSLTFSQFSGTGGCEEQSLPLTGAAVGDVVRFGLPTTFPAGIVVGAGYVSAAGQATLRLCRLGGTSTISGATFTAQILRSF